MSFVDDVFAQRLADDYVDPQVSVDEACVKIRERIPLALEGLCRTGFPAHQYSKTPAREIRYEGALHWAWVLEIGTSQVPISERRRNRRTEYEMETRAIAACVIGDDSNSLELRLLYNQNIDRFEYTELLLERLSPPQAWAVAKFLDAIGDQPKIMPWER